MVAFCLYHALLYVLTITTVTIMQNEIKREILINASQERVYSAIADPKQVVMWFPESIEGNYQVGEQVAFNFDECGKSQVYVEDAKPHEYFAYRWVPGASPYSGDVLLVPNTLVEFYVEALSANSCKVTLIESGFAQLPIEVIEASYKGNVEGWDFMLDKLAMFLKR